MRRLNNLLLLCMAVMLWSCNTSGEYVEHNGTICYSYWTFSFGTQYKELPKVNPITFESINGWLGNDDKHVYFKERLVEGADCASIKEKKFPLFCDKNDYYYQGVPLHVANVKLFEVIKWNEEDMWAIDGKYAYYDSLRIDNVDLPTFKLQSYNVATDRNHVYRYGKVFPLADPATYIEDWKGFYSRDKSHIWYMGELMEDVDYETFVVDKDGARDKNGHFYHGKRVSEEEWKEIGKDEDL